MAAHMKDAGWEYVVVDIEWYVRDTGTLWDKHRYILFREEEIDTYGGLLPDVNRFPFLADGYVSYESVSGIAGEGHGTDGPVSGEPRTVG